MIRTLALIVLSTVSLAVMPMLASCGGDGDDASPGTSQRDDAETLLQQAQAAMRNLDSFQLEMTSIWDGREITYTVAWQRPDSFHVLHPLLERYSEDHQETITDKGFFEGIAVGDTIYLRDCAAEGEGCAPWGEGPRGGIYVPASAPGLEPMWTIELLGVVSGAEVVGEEDIEGVICTRIQGRANTVQAMIQSWRAADEERGPIYWGEECTTTLAEPDGEVQEECHETTLEHQIALVQDSLRAQDENPPSVEVWLGRDDKLMRRLEFGQAVSDEEAAPASFTFSRFNEVSIEPPQ